VFNVVTEVTLKDGMAEGLHNSKLLYLAYAGQRRLGGILNGQAAQNSIGSAFDFSVRVGNSYQGFAIMRPSGRDSSPTMTPKTLRHKISPRGFMRQNRRINPPIGGSISTFTV